MIAAQAKGEQDGARWRREHPLPAQPTLGDVLRGWYAVVDAPRRDGRWESITDADLAASAASLEVYGAGFRAGAGVAES